MGLLHRTAPDKFALTERMMGDELPRYAILSHTWLPDDENGVTLEDLTQGRAATKRESYAKIQFCG